MRADDAVAAAYAHAVHRQKRRLDRQPAGQLHLARAALLRAVADHAANRAENILHCKEHLLLSAAQHIDHADRRAQSARHAARADRRQRARKRLDVDIDEVRQCRGAELGLLVDVHRLRHALDGQQQRDALIAASRRRHDGHADAAHPRIRRRRAELFRA